MLFRSVLSCVVKGVIEVGGSVMGREGGRGGGEVGSRVK